MLKRIAMSFAGAALIALAIAIPASASTVPGAAACTVSGKATITSAGGVAPVGGTGTFSFTAGAGTTPLTLNCVVSDGNGGVSVQTLSAASGGSFGNIVCGTGYADGANGAPTVTANTGTASAAVWTGINFSYHIAFTAGVGALVFTIPSAVTGAGPIVITPLFGTGEPNTTTCTSAFEVDGALAGVLVPSPVNDALLPHVHL